MRRRVPDLAGRPLLAGCAALGLVLAAAAGPLSSVLHASEEIEAARARLAAAREAVSRPRAAAPLAGPSADALLAALREHLDTLAAGRAAVIDAAEVAPDPDRPALPRLRASLRGTAEGLHGLVHALETGAPLIAVEEADLGILRPADAETGRPTVMRLAVTVRGVLTPAEPAPRGAGP
ncbi:GspMb/PilO family protein [Methylobacterium oryzisoli]|uniref:GspMb/PilO family protein n=1 Tax=Methylobacterium oryzisoli TaxID=3385502 RepID=UPI003892265A